MKNLKAMLMASTLATAVLSVPSYAVVAADVAAVETEIETAPAVITLIASAVLIVLAGIHTWKYLRRAF